MGKELVTMDNVNVTKLITDYKDSLNRIPGISIRINKLRREIQTRINKGDIAGMSSSGSPYSEVLEVVSEKKITKDPDILKLAKELNRGLYNFLKLCDKTLLEKVLGKKALATLVLVDRVIRLDNIIREVDKAGTKKLVVFLQKREQELQGLNDELEGLQAVQFNIEKQTALVGKLSEIAKNSQPSK